VSRAEPEPKQRSRRAPVGARPVEQRGGGTCGDAGLPPRENHNPAPRSIRIFERVDEVEISRRVVVLEREQPHLRQPNTLGFSSGGELEGRRGEGREGNDGARSRDLRRLSSVRNLEERNPRRHRRGDLAKPQSYGRAAHGVHGTPDVELRIAVKRGTRNHEGPGVRKDVRRCVWNKASKGNPKSGSGMKQARKVARGTKRREGAKP